MWRNRPSTCQKGRAIFKVDTDLPNSIYLLILCLVLSGVFSASETSITATGRGKLLAIKERKPPSKSKLYLGQLRIYTGL